LLLLDLKISLILTGDAPKIAGISYITDCVADFEEIFLFDSD
jgi:hypothetical protein